MYIVVWYMYLLSVSKIVSIVILLLCVYTGTVVRQGEGGAMRDVNEAFSLLEEDLWRRERGGGGGEGEGEVRRRELVRMSLPVTLMERRGEGERGGDYLSFSSRRRDTASPLSVVRTASDTEAIFDDILSQIHNASRYCTCTAMLDHPTQSTQVGPTTLCSLDPVLYQLSLSNQNDVYDL